MKVLNVVGARPNLMKIAPGLTLRENTEGPISVTQGTNVLVGTDPARIVAATQEALAGRSQAGCVPELWDGHAPECNVAILRERLG
jgi:UDP-N-acetylglucosamine 2-epimerase (non-hydrolysing)